MSAALPIPGHFRRVWPSVPCPVVGCRRLRVPNQEVVCPACWGKLPESLQLKIIEEIPWEEGTEEYRDGVAEVVAFLRDQEKEAA